ncbi:LPS assembly lipoprotein LptE [Desulfospira joergensenii]|uniref:LPS assembly lipoprotein LptE n=1 Tax=Desulfospira joergensenii TaxID=53329 RepID=UPI0003B36907|nr:LPS assembly lipoprotein LptE [Desulfospira joergensenii]
MDKKFGILLALVIMVSVFSCGYRLEGGGYIKENVTRVAVEVFENNSSQTRAGLAFTNELIREILEKTDTKVVDSSRATRRIVGVVKAIKFSTLSRTSTETVVERRVTAVVDVRLVGPDDEILWSVRDFSSHEDYTVAEDKVDDDGNIREAVDKIATRSAERLVSQMMVNF